MLHTMFIVCIIIGALSAIYGLFSEKGLSAFLLGVLEIVVCALGLGLGGYGWLVCGIIMSCIWGRLIFKGAIVSLVGLSDGNGMNLVSGFIVFLVGAGMTTLFIVGMCIR